MVSEEGVSTNFLASFADGSIKMYDRRLDDDEAVVRSFAPHNAWVQNIKWRLYQGQFMSARLVVTPDFLGTSF